jgi:hypothetical protein
LVQQSQHLSVDNYIKFLSNFERVSTIKPGFVYAYVYRSSKEYPIDTLKFFDIFPLAFITDVDYSKQTFHGLNFHHMPVPLRLLWYRRISAIINIQKVLTMKKTVNNLAWLNYSRMKKVFQFSDRIVRQYRFDRVKLLRIVPFENMQEILRLYANTYYGVTVNQVNRKFFEV